MKKVLSLLTVVVMMGSLLGCKASSGNETQGAMQTPETTVATTAAPTEPSEPEMPKIVIVAPFDIYNYDPTQAKEIDLQIKEGYQFLIRDENYRNCYTGYLSSFYYYILTYPVILEESVQDAPLEYEFRTNGGALYTNYKSMYEHYAGQTAKMVKEYMIWAGHDDLFHFLIPQENQQDAYIWLDIVASKDGKPVGFAVLQLVYGAIEEKVWSLVYRYSEFYPTAEEGTEITEEFVNSRIDACHQYFMNNAE